MSILRRLSFLIIFTSMLSACVAPSSIGVPNAVPPLGPTETALPPLFEAPPDATATPTPFQPIPPTAAYEPTEIPTATPSPTPILPFELPTDIGPVGDIQAPSGIVNILLLGSDMREWWGKGSLFRTDTIILAMLNPEKGIVSLVSFPRDLYVQIPGYGQDRINTAWGRGGFKKLASTLEYNFGVKVDHYVLIEFSDFKRIVDSLGGLDVQVGERLTDYYRGRQILIKPGLRTMNADMVLWYVRSRKTSNDFSRNRRQQEVLQALVNKFLSMDAIKRAPEFYAAYKSSVKTDLSLVDMLPFISLATQLGDSKRVQNYFVGSGKVTPYVTPGGAQVLLPQKDKIVRLLQKAMEGGAE
jgi:polyisoprenyl-teichoic acid--peptidoglycan teichoic acid transferase